MPSRSLLHVSAGSSGRLSRVRGRSVTIARRASRDPDASPESVEADFLAVALPDGPLSGAAARLDGTLGGRIAPLARGRRRRARARKRHARASRRRARGAAPRDRGRGQGRTSSTPRRCGRRPRRRPAPPTGSAGRSRGCSTRTSRSRSRSRRPRSSRASRSARTSRRAGARSRSAASRSSGSCSSAAATASPTRRSARARSPTGRTAHATSINSPPNEATPECLAAEAEEIAGSLPNLEAEALDRGRDGRAEMGSLLAVAQGSHNEPRLIVLRYEPPNPVDPDVVLGFVGKAITFDTGGISLKPSLHMEDMKGDMGGGGAVLEAMGALADLQLPVRAIAVIAAAENMPGGHAYRPGDILTAANGKTIEVTNTDAEGRLVLADALWYARREGATHVDRPRDADRRDGGRARRPLRGLLRERRGLERGDRRGRRAERRPRLALPAPPALPPLRRLELRRHEELVRPAPGGRRARRRVPARVRRRGAVGARRHRRARVPRPLARGLHVRSAARPATASACSSSWPRASR